LTVIYSGAYKDNEKSHIYFLRLFLLPNSNKSSV
jgi:hypothetical protein